MIAGVQLCMAECLGESKFVVFTWKNSATSFCQGNYSVFFVYTKHISVAVTEEEICSSALQLALEFNQDLKILVKNQSFNGKIKKNQITVMHVIYYFLLILKPWEHGCRGVCGITITVILQLNEN